MSTLVGWRRQLGLWTLVLALAWTLLGGTLPAYANRFGPPWQSQVVVDSTTAFSQPDKSSPPIGPLYRGAIVVVVGQPTADWTPTTLGYVQSSDVLEDEQPWIAQVTVPGVSIYARPFKSSGIRRTANQGDLLRVTGVSPGLEGDSGIWWATTEGYVDLGSLVQATGQWAEGWTLPDPSLAPSGWWSRVISGANVRAGATTDAPVVGKFAGGEMVKVLAQVQGQSAQGSDVWDRIDGGRYAGAYVHSILLSTVAAPVANTAAPSGSPDGEWIVVDRTADTLTLVQDGHAVFVTYVALGEAGRQTPSGTYSTFLKYTADDMTSASVSGATDAYDLPNVPDTQYYLDGGYAIHGTYWHDLFGTQQSHGCINVSWTDGAYLFGLTQPSVPDGQLRASAGAGPATPVVIVN
ncbi:MAG: L,D-transpeptidase family protein [Chloroflexi bacterium]|nr:L,D-transpeptidase family protein [Chloroflexota bacterium]